MSELISTGIEGLDVLLAGGLRPGTCALIEGQPGTGKTTIGSQFVYDGCNHAEPGIIVTFEEFPEQIYADVAKFGWDLRELEQRGLLKVICTSPDVFLEELSSADGIIDAMIREMGARRILVDSVSHLLQVAETPKELRSQVYGMFNGLKRAGLTSMLTKEISGPDSVGAAFEEYMADTVINLVFEIGADYYRRRYIEVLKCRGQNHFYGKHTLKLGSHGAEVYPRRADRPSCRHQPGPPLSTGIDGLDDMLAGGIKRGQAILVAGSAGVGKTSLGLSFACAGAAAGEPGVYVSFQEPPDALAVLAEGFGMPAERLQRESKLSFMHFPPVHLRTDELMAQLERRVTEIGAQRVVIDSITDLALAGQDTRRLRETVYILCSTLKQHCVTGMLISEVPELFGQSYVTSEHISIIADGVVLMKYVEMESEIQRAISVLKMRGSDHDKGIRRFTIDGSGVHVHSRFEGTEGLMAGRTRPVSITLSVRSFTEIDEHHNEELLTRFAQIHPRVAPVSVSLPYNPDEARSTVEGALAAETSELAVAPLCLYWMPEILKSRRLIPLDGLLQADELEEHIPELLEAGRHDGRLYAIPALAACGVLLYRKDLLEEFGFDGPPSTWDELINQARTIVDGSKEEELIGYQFPAYMYEGLATSFLQNLWSNDGDIVTADGQFGLQPEQTLEALTFMHDLIHVQRLVPQNMVSAAHGLEPQRDFIEGRTVFLTLLPSVAQAAQQLDSPVRGKIGITGPPMGPHGTQSRTFLSGWSYGVPVGARAPETARQFIRFMTDPQVQKERALRGGPLPTIERLYSDPEVLAFNPEYQHIRGMLRTARRRSNIPNYPQVSKLIQRHLYTLLKAETSPEQCLEALRSGVAEMTGR